MEEERKETKEKKEKKVEHCPLNEEQEVNKEECRKCGFHDCPVRKV